MTRLPEFPQIRMPSFDQTSSDAEITAILGYLQSRWGPEARGYRWHPDPDLGTEETARSHRRR